jgi:tetratricopeptide (TPR) repeat protein
MKTIKAKILILTVAAGFSTVAYSSISPASENIFRRHAYSSSDTSDLNRHIRNALDFFSKLKDLKDINYLKASIDTAELICVEKKIEFPSALHLVRAEYFFLTNDFRSASQEATIALKKSKSNGETEILAKTMSFLGVYSLRTKFFMESISYFENAISIAEKSNLKGIIPASYFHLADVYDYLGNLKEKRNTLKKLIEAANKENNKWLMEVGLENLGKTYTEGDRNFKLADSIFRECIEIALVTKDTLYISWPMTDRGWNFYLEKEYDQAIKCYNQSLSYSLPAKIYSISANALGNLGTIYRDLGDNEKSIKYYVQSIDHAKKGNVIFHLSWVYKDISDMYLGMKDSSNAYKNYVLFKLYSDSLLKKSSSQGLTDARIRYEADSHNKEVELLSLRLYNQRLIIYGAAGLFVLSVAVLILLLSRAKINAKRRISEMNRKISEITQANLRQQMNPHFIFNTLNSIQYYMYQHDKLATNNYLTKFSSLMRKVLENSQHTSVPLRDELDALNLYLELEMIRFKDKFDYEINVDEEIDALLYKVPTMLIQPYVENSICHGLMPGENKGFVKIDLKLNNDHILCTIEDNGIGRDAALEKKKKSDSNHNSLGTQIVSSRLDLVNALYGTSLKTIYIDLKNENGEPAGTRVEIQIPILS